MSCNRIGGSRLGVELKRGDLIPCWLHNQPRWTIIGPIRISSQSPTAAIGSWSSPASSRPSWACSAFFLRGGRCYSYNSRIMSGGVLASGGDD